MIIGVWKPIYKIKIIFSYEKIDNFNSLKEKGSSNFKVLWKCDGECCKFPNKLHSTSNHHLKSKNCNSEKQICKSCQTKGSNNPRFGDYRKWDEFFTENELENLKLEKSKKWKENNISKLDSVKVKKGQIIINFDNVKKKLNMFNYDLITIEGDNKNSIMEIICPKNHTYSIKYKNFFNSKNSRCKECYYDSLKFDIKHTNDFILYKKLVYHYTNKSYRNYKEIINPLNLKRSRDFHLDHKYSISEGFKNGILPPLIGNYHNLEIINSKENLSKNKKCSIDLETLLEKIFN